MKFVWCGGGAGDVRQPSTYRPWPAWLQLVLDNIAQRRAERQQQARRDALGVTWPTTWWP